MPRVPIVIITFFLTLFLSTAIIGPVTCSSGWASPSIGKSGACSSHGGVAKWKGILPLILSGFAAFWIYGRLERHEKKLPEKREQYKSPQLSPIDRNETVEIISKSSPAPKPTKKSSAAVKCPKCNGRMALRTAKQGANKGQKFWGCSKFPRCKGTKAYVPFT